MTKGPRDIMAERECPGQIDGGEGYRLRHCYIANCSIGARNGPWLIV